MICLCLNINLNQDQKQDQDQEQDQDQIQQVVIFQLLVILVQKVNQIKFNKK
jgi:hypothetical protein